MATQVLEGTWEEIMRHAKEFVGRKVRITVLEEESLPTPNYEMLESLRKASERSKNMPVSSDKDTSDLIREARAERLRIKPTKKRLKIFKTKRKPSQRAMMPI